MEDKGMPEGQKDGFPRDEKGKVKCDGLKGKDKQRCEVQAKKEAVQKTAEKALGMKKQKE
jgi:hypothetical protein